MRRWTQRGSESGACFLGPPCCAKGNLHCLVRSVCWCVSVCLCTLCAKCLTQLCLGKCLAQKAQKPQQHNQHERSLLSPPLPHCPALARLLSILFLARTVPGNLKRAAAAPNCRQRKRNAHKFIYTCNNSVYYWLRSDPSCAQLLSCPPLSRVPSRCHHPFGTFAITFN